MVYFASVHCMLILRYTVLLSTSTKRIVTTCTITNLLSSVTMSGSLWSTGCRQRFGKEFKYVNVMYGVWVSSLVLTPVLTVKWTLECLLMNIMVEWTITKYVKNHIFTENTEVNRRSILQQFSINSSSEKYRSSSIITKSKPFFYLSYVEHFLGPNHSKVCEIRSSTKALEEWRKCPIP